MDDDQDVQDQLTDAESIGVTRSCFCSFKELKQTRQPQQPVESKKRSVADSHGQVQEVSWKDGADVEFTLQRSNVRFSQTAHIFN